MARPPRVASFALVIAQMASIAALVGPLYATRFHALGFVPIAASIGLMSWTLWHNRPGNFSVMPEPRAGAVLVTTGPYSRMRHPMYTAVIVFGAGCAIGWSTPLHAAALVALVIVLDFKARREERLLAVRFRGYDAYMQRTGRFLPRGSRWRPR